MKQPPCDDSRVLPDLPCDPKNPLYLPFYYGSISSFWLHFLIDVEKLVPLLDCTGLVPANFGGKGLVNLNFQNYTAHNGNSLAATSELEFNIIAYPEAKENDVPKISAECFLTGQDQTKTLGNYRVHVPCDNKFAVKAGIGLFGENKFFAQFNYVVPSPNLPLIDTWTYTISDEDNNVIIEATADFHEMVPSIANPSAIVNYSMLDSRLVGSRRNILSTAHHYFPLSDAQSDKIKVSIGDSPVHQMSNDLEIALGKSKSGEITTPVFAIQVVQSPPVIIESRPYYAGYV